MWKYIQRKASPEKTGRQEGGCGLPINSAAVDRDQAEHREGCTWCGVLLLHPPTVKDLKVVGNGIP